jgi:hypothetical protein
MSKKEWDNHKTQIWDKEISEKVRKPLKWADALHYGAVHFMEGWHEKQNELSIGRCQARVLKHIRFIGIVFRGWVPMAERREWEKFEVGMKEIRYLACQAYEESEVGKKKDNKKKKKNRKKEVTRWGRVCVCGDVRAPLKKRTIKSVKDWKEVQRGLLEKMKT